MAITSRRLAILDLSPAGDQPLHSEDGRFCIAYNGELYNEPELRHALSARGFAFRSRTDTETVLNAYRDRGVESLSTLNGMFALAIVDQARGRVVLARDRMGIKPLYYTWDGHRLAFSSELRTLVREAVVSFRIDPEALDLFLTFGFVPAPYSLIDGVRKLEPGSWLTVDSTGEIESSKFWSPRSTSPVDRDPRSAAEAVRATVRDAVRRQMRSDVPVGVLLSGGIDSSIVAVSAAASTAQRLSTFTVSFQSEATRIGPELNLDADYARRLSQHLDSRHHEVVLDDDVDLPGVVRRLAVDLDEPVWEASFVSINAISGLAAQAGVKVLLTGDGGDELFLGYPWHATAWRQAKYERLPLLREASLAIARLSPSSSRIGAHARNVIGVAGASDADRYLWTHRVFAGPERVQLIGSDRVQPPVHSTRLIESLLADVPSGHLGERIALLDLLLWVREHFNQRIDRMTMLNSIEARVPFQDNEVVDLALALPYHTRAPYGRPKHLLRAAFRRDVPAFVLERPKRPFAAPMAAWLTGPLRSLVAEYLDPDRVRDVGLVDPDAAAGVSSRGSVDDERWVRQMWTLLMLHLWADGLRRIVRSE